MHSESDMADVDSTLFVFCKWDLDKSGAISQDVLVKVLTELSDMSVDEIHILFEHIDADSSGSIEYEEFANWLVSSTLPSDNLLLQKCRCPDGHEFSTYAPEVDGWCCEECGDDLEVNQEALQCFECAGLCWCIKCTLGQTDVKNTEEIALATARLTAAMHMPVATKEVEDVHDQCGDQQELIADEALDEDGLEAHNQPTEGPVRLNICGLAGLLCTLDADRKWTVHQTKEAIESMTGIPEYSQSLVFGFLALQDVDVLGYLQIPDGSEMILLRRSELQTEWLQTIRTKPKPDDRPRSFLDAAPEEIRADRLIVLEAVSRSGEDLQYASCDLRGDREIVLAAAKIFPSSLVFATPQLLGDYAFALEAVQMYGLLLQFMPQEIRANRDIVIAAVSNNGPALLYANEGLLLDSALAELAVEQGFSLRRTRSYRLGEFPAVALAAARKDRNEVAYVSQRLRADRWFAMELLKLDPWHMRNISRDLTQDDEVVNTALDYGFSLETAPEKLRSNRNVVYLTVQRRGLELAYASTDIRANRKIVTAAVRKTGLALQHASFQLRNERKIVEVAAKQDTGALKFAGAHLRNVWDC
jgi:hypothetical protein